MTRTERLLALRNADGHWTGQLSTSALSTATAAFALFLALPKRPELRPLVDGGVRWLIAHQSADGGWGDTVRSPSNISTTTLCWAALRAVTPEAHAAISAADAWLTRAAGSLDPDTLATAIADRYGKDRTFSVPILTLCALAGCLGDTPWRRIPRLPFELAALPHQWFQWLQLPVVSYALPALIAIGQVGHHANPTPNPVLRALRNRARARTLAILQSIQPAGGGFLEAAPLTSFVTMSLLAMGLHDSPVVDAGIDFLVRSVRGDGSWPIDTNLATWVTTLAINALGTPSPLPDADRTRLRDWLLGQQLQTEHPYTHAAPGGWAWTDLPGGVPDADDTPGALLALWNLDDGRPTSTTRDAAERGIGWLLDLQNRDGGMPTFCRGWGALPFDRSGADLTAHALHAWARWRPALDAPLQRRIDAATDRALRYLYQQQRADGSWLPLWFGNDAAPDEANPTYGTSRVLVALNALDRPDDRELAERRARGIGWLLAAQGEDGGWGGDRGCPPSIEETGLALQALADTPHADAHAYGLRWLDAHTDTDGDLPAAPIGFYFARLWYFEALYPVVYAAGATPGSTPALIDTQSASM